MHQRAVATTNRITSAASDRESLIGEFDPIASNDATDTRAKNRRIEITLVPNMDELIAAPASVPEP